MRGQSSSVEILCHCPARECIYGTNNKYRYGMSALTYFLPGSHNLGLLYTRLGAGPSTGLIHVLLSPQPSPILSTFFGSNLVTCKVMRSDLRSRCSWGERVVKRINLPWTDSRHVHYPTNEPNLTHVESSGWGKTCPNFLKLVRMFGTLV